ncbi:protease modulator HflC [Candidatus Mesenet endosymbiont of Agriotes lineatus]|uniref:protease modulator HflC n=1 Tax=Candidatus Mesenet endosymbiont of Agriotes lineatus TaxID=3077948 RepID=UPI0030D5022B
MSKNIIKIVSVVFCFLLFFTISNSIFIVSEEKQAIVLQFGKVARKINSSGLYFKLPLIQNIVSFDKRIIDISSDYSSREIITFDQKRFIADAYAKYRIIDPVLFYQTVKTELGLAIRLGSIIEANVREKVGTISLVNLLNSERSEVINLIKEGVSNESQKFGVDVIDVRIKRLDLPEENSAAIFRRMQTEREKEAKEIRAEGEESAQKIRSETEKQKRIIIADAIREAQEIRGRGDALAAKIYNTALVIDQEFFSFYRSMQAYKNAFSSSNTKMILSPNNDFLHLFNKEQR